jgi:YegS/Rv2252/BmrU family lipid kinase
MNKIHYVVNPASQNGATGRRWAAMQGLLPAAEAVHLTTRAAEAVELAEKAAQSGADMVVAVGGDGTLSEVATGLMRLPEGKRPPLGIMPCGTGGDFRKTLGLPTDPAAVASVLRRAHTRDIDVGRVRFVGHDGSAEERYFINVCSFGISGVVDEAVNKTSKALGGKISFLIGSIRGLATFKPVEVEVSLDGGAFEKHTATLVAACNGRLFGGGMMVAPTADPSDGRFDIVIIDDVQGLDKLQGWRIYNGSHLGQPNVHYRSAKKLEARANGTALMDIDGEALGRVPVTIEVVAAALKVVC